MRATHDPPSDGYPRPQQAWQCGLADGALPCGLGPSAGGHCPAAEACHPTRVGDRWQCNRSPLRGGPCAQGPGPDGACSIVHRCTPRRSQRKRRGRFVGGVLVAAVGAACMALSGDWRVEFLAPGPLSVHHAHLLGGQQQTMRCTQCHAGSDASLAAWVGLASRVGSPDAAASQSTLCMKCHEKSLPVEWATAAHNLPLAALRDAANRLPLASRQWESPGEYPLPHWRDASGTPSSSSSQARRDPAHAIACSACHHEHHGWAHDLTVITDAACQACHREQFHSFADDHPDFGAWPYARRTRIAFNHASHELKHHPAEKSEFACANCHVADSSGAWQLTRDYATSCAACHDKPLALSLVDGVPLVSLPMLDLTALADAGHGVGAWPANGDFDGALPMPAKLLLAASPQAAAALATLGSTFDFYDIDPDDAAQLAATQAIAEELRVLVEELATRGQPAIADRLTAVLGRQLTAAELEALAGRLSPDVAAQYRDRWFGKATTDDDRAAQQARVPGGGWIRDDATLALRYQPTGHADPWQTAWLDALAAAATGPQAAIAEPLLRAALKPTAPGQCGSCHSIERTNAGQLAIQWRPREPGAMPPGLTRFSHAPHVLQTQLRDCTACHAVAGDAVDRRYATDKPQQFVADFARLSKATCVTCHTSRGAGDSCTQCHNYHSGQWAVAGEQLGGDVGRPVIQRSAEESTRQ